MKIAIISSLELCIKPLNANPEKWPNTLKQIVGNLPTICLSVFDHFMSLALKGLSTMTYFGVAEIIPVMFFKMRSVFIVI